MPGWTSEDWGRQDSEQEKRNNDFIEKRNRENLKRQMEILKNNPPPKPKGSK